jgi:hypothetical protein
LTIGAGPERDRPLDVFSARFECHTRSRAFFTSSMLRPETTLSGRASTISSSSLAAASRP